MAIGPVPPHEQSIINVYCTVNTMVVIILYYYELLKQMFTVGGDGTTLLCISVLSIQVVLGDGSKWCENVVSDC